MYHSCGQKDDSYDSIYQTWPVAYASNEWMTFQLHVKIGTWYQNDRRYRNDSLIELWISREGQPALTAISEKYDLANNDQQAKYGKVWLLPYLSGKDPTQEHSAAFTWFDELIISRARIADPL